jgi:hypothetical protein
MLISSRLTVVLCIVAPRSCLDVLHLAFAVVIYFN